MQGCAFPGSPGKRDDRADDNGQPLPATTAKPLVWTHLAHRAAIAEWDALRRLERRVVAWQHPTGHGWWVTVLDGWGQLVEDRTPPGGYTHHDARGAANAAVDDLRAQTHRGHARWRTAR